VTGEVEVVGTDTAVEGVDDDDVAVSGLPPAPDGLIGGILEPGQPIGLAGDQVVLTGVRNPVDAQELDLKPGPGAWTSGEQAAEVTKLVTAIASTGGTEVIDRDLEAVIAWRNRPAARGEVGLTSRS